MTTCVVLLRGVNVGRANRIAMATFREVLEGVGCTNVRTYVQSGNAVVSWDGAPGALEVAVRQALPLDVPVMVRTASELVAAVAACPWPELDPALLHVAFLDGEVDPGRWAAVDHEALAPERVARGDRVLYLFHAGGVQRSRLARLRLGPAATARNWRTVQALVALCGVDP